MSYTILEMSGRVADTGEFDDSGRASIKVLEHRDTEEVEHTLVLDTAKYNCGAYREDAICSCGANYRNAMSGCWQYGHQRKESENGWDDLHTQIVREAYRVLPTE